MLSPARLSLRRCRTCSVLVADCHEDCLNCRITSWQAVCLEGATCDVCRHMSQDFWVPYTRRYLAIRMSLDDDSRRFHDKVMRDAGKVVHTDAAPGTSNEPDRSPQCDVTSSDAATANGTVMGSAAFGSWENDATSIVSGRCVCQHSGILGDPHPMCLRCSMNSGRPVCVRYHTCELCARKDKKFWGRYMKSYNRRRNRFSKERRDAYDQVMADAGKITVRNVFTTPEQRKALFKHGIRKTRKLNSASVTRIEQPRSTLSEASKRPTNTCGDDDMATGAVPLQAFSMDDASFFGDAHNDTRPVNSCAVELVLVDDNPHVYPCGSEANAIDLNVSNSNYMTSGDDEMTAGAFPTQTCMNDATCSVEFHHDTRPDDGCAVDYRAYDDNPHVAPYHSRANAIDVNCSNTHGMTSGASQYNHGAVRVVSVTSRQAPTTLQPLVDDDDDVRIIKYEKNAFGESLLALFVPVTTCRQ